MSEPQERVTQRLQAVLGLSQHAAERVLDEVLDCFDSDVDEHIRRRHAELQRSGQSNAAIYELLEVELSQLRFKAPPLSSRQIRRRIYG